MAAATFITKHQLQANLIQKCWREPAFRTEVVRNPRDMLAAFLRKTLPPDFRVLIHEDDAKTLHFSIPPAPANAAELSDQELERVAGGTELGLSITAIGSVAATVLCVGETIAKAGW